MVGVRWCRTSENPKVIRKIVMTAKLLKMNRLKIILKGKLEAYRINDIGFSLRPRISGQSRI